eukprot:scaffold54952_cov20-Prasinocladus_malaysianus.AAC.2
MGTSVVCPAFGRRPYVVASLAGAGAEYCFSPPAKIKNKLYELNGYSYEYESFRLRNEQFCNSIIMTLRHSLDAGRKLR